MGVRRQVKFMKSTKMHLSDGVAPTYVEEPAFRGEEPAFRGEEHRAFDSEHRATPGVAPTGRALAAACLMAISICLSTPVRADEIQDGLPICQIMKVEGDATLLEAPEKVSRPAKDPILDAVPVMDWIEPGASLKAVILCVHGLGLHKGTYAAFAEKMAKEGYAVYAVDVRGFGTFLEMPGHRKCDFPKCLDDVTEALNLVHKLHPGLPVFLLGESMGGAISLRVTANHPELVDGLISSVPAAERYGQTKSAIDVGMHLLTSPRKEMDISNVVVNRSTAKEELRQEWSRDPLARFKLTPVELMQFQSFMEDNEKSAKLIKKTPVLMLQGTKDSLVRHDANENIIKHIPSPDSQLIFVENAEHLIFEEGQFTDALLDIVKSWLTSHTPKTNLTADSAAGK